MSAPEILEEWSRRQDWSKDQQLDLLLYYIEDQADNQTFEDFLSRQAGLQDAGRSVTLSFPVPERDKGA